MKKLFSFLSKLCILVDILFPFVLYYHMASLYSKISDFSDDEYSLNCAAFGAFSILFIFSFISSIRTFSFIVVKLLKKREQERDENLKKLSKQLKM